MKNLLYTFCLTSLVSLTAYTMEEGDTDATKLEESPLVVTLSPVINKEIITFEVETHFQKKESQSERSLHLPLKRRDSELTIILGYEFNRDSEDELRLKPYTYPRTKSITYPQQQKWIAEQKSSNS